MKIGSAAGVAVAAAALVFGCRAAGPDAGRSDPAPRAEGVGCPAGEETLVPVAAIACGTVTPMVRIEGDLEGKGSSGLLVRGAWMKFDLSHHPPDFRVAPAKPGTNESSAVLRVRVKSAMPFTWTWVSHIRMDPVAAPAGKLFAEIRAHRVKFTGSICGMTNEDARIPPLCAKPARNWARTGPRWANEPNGWRRIPLPSDRATAAINAVLARPDKADRWIAMALAFECHYGEFLLYGGYDDPSNRPQLILE